MTQPRHVDIRPQGPAWTWSIALADGATIAGPAPSPEAARRSAAFVAANLQALESLARGHPADAITPRELFFTFQSVAFFQFSAVDAVQKSTLNLVIERNESLLVERLGWCLFGHSFSLVFVELGKIRSSA